MKKITTILTALILMFTLTFTTGCKKDGGVDPNKNKTTTEVVVGNDWKFTNSSPIKRVSSIDTIVSFELDSTLTISSNGTVVFSGKPNVADGLFKNTFYTNVDSINVNFEIEGDKIGERSDKIYNYTYNLVLNRNTQTLTGTKTLIRKDVFFTPDGWVKTSPITLSIKD